MKIFDTSKLFERLQECLRYSSNKNYISALSGVSLYRMDKASRTNMDFDNLKVREIHGIQLALNLLDVGKYEFWYPGEHESGESGEWELLDVDLDTSQIYYDLMACLHDKDAKRIITALSGVSPYRMKKVIKSEDDFNDLKLNEVIKIGELIDDLHNNVYEF